ncbi:MAG: hypothetical protein QOK05_689 [Chloroflexota bacterium]|jgi:hypothetical protein|nr:hypothetical protein [Chloroflexota bacterium]
MALAGAIVGLALAGCSGSATGPAADASLPSALISNPPAGYSPSATGTGPLDVQGASYSTPADVDQTAAILKAQAFRAGYVKVWQKGPDYITAAIYRFDTASHALAFADFEKASISGEVGSYVYVLTQPSWGTGFVITSKNKTRTKLIFCQGGLFALETDVSLVQTCGEQPNSSTMVDALTNQQYLQASGVMVFGSVSPAPSKPSNPPVASP